MGHKTILCFCHHSGTLEPTFRQLETMKLDKSPFVIISVVGQELLGAAQYAAAVIVLEAALRIGTCSLKLRGSVFSALSSAYWALNSLDKVHVTRSQVWNVAISNFIELCRVWCWYTSITEVPRMWAGQSELWLLAGVTASRLAVEYTVGTQDTSWGRGAAVTVLWSLSLTCVPRYLVWLKTHG